MRIITTINFTPLHPIAPINIKWDFIVINIGTRLYSSHCNLEADTNRLSQFNFDALLVLYIIFVCNKHFKHLFPHGKASFFNFPILAVMLNC